MNNLFPLKAAVFFSLVLVWLWSPACNEPANPCIKSLFGRDERLIQQADSLFAKGHAMPLQPYRAGLQKLRIEEEQIFSEVKNCDFGEDLRSYNYWHRGRLKFPSKIDQELQRLERDSAGK